ncbi:unnamed protein product [Lymnaea stagnalis]|uniref:RCC1 domain-containing protein 1 n=1 Tax=Lymnaea stagnalis TaxID=6523 RepID=A0AAV2H0Y2_LYMST
MPTSLYGCGFDGFSQLSSFLLTNSDNLSRNAKPDQKKRNAKIIWPIQLFLNLSDSNTVYSNAITWARVVVTIKKDQNSYTSYVTELPESEQCLREQKDQSQLLNVLDQSIVVAASDKDVVLKESVDAKINIIFKDDNINAQALQMENITEGTSMKRIVRGGHKYFFSACDTKLVKLKASKCTSKCTCDEANLVMRFEIDPIIMGISIKDVSCGKEHVLLLGENGSIYSYGFGSRGQLGHNSVEGNSSPTLIEALDGLQMRAIAAGGWHSAAISDIGDLYMWGWNESGQLGISLVKNERNNSGSLSVSFDETVHVQAEPHCIAMNEEFNAVAVACGARHTAFLSDDGKVYVCGWNDYGQLGLGHLESQRKFTEVEALQKLKCVHIFAGQWNTFFVCEIKLNDKKVKF